MENAKKFFDETLATEEAKKLIATEKRKETLEEIVSAYLDIAAKLGANITAEELEAFFEEKLKKATATGELDDDEMAFLCGGRGYDCYSSYVDRENCWANDGCDYINNNYANYNCSWSNKGACAMLYEDNDDDSASSSSLAMPGSPTKFG